MSLNPVEDIQDTTDSRAEEIRWALQLPERIRQLVRDEQREQAEKDFERLKALLENWENVKDSQELLSQCKVALAFWK